MPKMSLNKHMLVALLLGVLVAAAYAPIVGVPFLSDDFTVIRLVSRPDWDPRWNPLVKGGYWEYVLSEFYAGLLYNLSVYRPLYMLSFGIDYALHGVNPIGYHLMNLGLHLVSSFWVYLLALELVQGRRRTEIAITAGVLFALYPVSPGAVTWPAGRVDVICTVFFVPTLLFFLRWLRTEKGTDLILSLASFALALLSKETAIVLPGLLLLCALYRRKGLRGTAISVAPFAVTLAVFFAFRTYLLMGAEPGYVESSPLYFPVRLWGFAYATLHMFLPINLGLLPTGPRSFLHTLLLSWPILLAVVLAAAAYLFVKAKDKLPLLLLALYALPLLPVFRALGPDPELKSGRWFYIPAMFIAMLIAYALWSVAPGRTRLSLAVAALISAAFLAMLVFNNVAYLRAGEIGNELLRAGKTPEQFPVRHKGAFVYGTQNMWNAANSPPFKSAGKSPRSP